MSEQKYFICPEDRSADPDCIPYIEAENIEEAKEKMCATCMSASPDGFACDGPSEVTGESEIEKIKKALAETEDTDIETSMITQKTWQEFRDTGLLWWINSILHTFGWAICVEIENGVITNSYPARVRFRGFDEKNNTAGYIKVSEYMKQHADEMLEEAKS